MVPCVYLGSGVLLCAIGLSLGIVTMAAVGGGLAVLGVIGFFILRFT